MKKTYQKPNINVVYVELQQMIAESMGLSEKNANPENNMLSRGQRGRFFDDEED